MGNKLKPKYNQGDKFTIEVVEQCTNVTDRWIYLIVELTSLFIQKKLNQPTNQPTKVHCLFEQSGTFKNEFIKLGIPAEDYDIQNEFGETDHIIDLFAEIENAYEGKASIFDDIKESDLIFAFFPCVRFENQIMLWFRGQNFAQKKWNIDKKLEYNIKIHEELNHLYKVISKLAIVIYRKNLRCVIENPYSNEHYLVRYWCIKSQVIDRDRRIRGDYYAKPTQYWFLNCYPTNSIIKEVVQDNSIKIKNAITKIPNGNAVGAKNLKTARSMIHPQYANRFIREFILQKRGKTMNKVILTNARLTKDPEIRYSQGEKPMCIARFTLAVDKNYKKSPDEPANFINCICFGKTAEVAEKYLKKGTKVNVEGEWITGSYEDKNGNRVYTNECNISKLEFAESKAAAQQNATNDEGYNPAPSKPDFMDIPSDMGDSLPFK